MKSHNHAYIGKNPTEVPNFEEIFHVYLDADLVLALDE